MSDDGGLADGEQHLTESEDRQVDYDVVTPAYIWQEVYSKLKSDFSSVSVSGDITDLCTKYVKPVVFESESDDPINFISDGDKTECDKYKEEGNLYFKAKDYKHAIIKYTTALRMYFTFQPRTFEPV